MQTKIGRRIQQKRIEKGLSVDELAKRLNKNRATIYRYENGDIEKLPISILKNLADILDISPASLIGWEDENIVKIAKIKIPVLGSVACGQPIFAEENLDCYVDAINNIHADYALWAKGDSMIDARINDGDLIFVKKQDMVENGEIAVVLIDEEVTLKKFIFEKDKNRVILVPANSKYLPFIYEGEDIKKVHVIGKAVAFQSKL